MMPPSLTSQILSLCKDDLNYTSDFAFLDKVGCSLKKLPMNAPLRKWWSGQMFEYLRGKKARPEMIELANSAFLHANGITVDDEISLDF